MHFAIEAVHCEDLMIITPILLCNIASGNGARIFQEEARRKASFLGEFLHDVFNSMGIARQEIRHKNQDV